MVLHASKGYMATSMRSKALIKIIIQRNSAEFSNIIYIKSKEFARQTSYISKTFGILRQTNFTFANAGEEELRLVYVWDSRADGVHSSGTLLVRKLEMEE